MPSIEINYFAVTTVALLAFFLGALWYSPLMFASTWMKLNGYTQKKLKSMQKTAPQAHAISALTYLIMALIMAVLISYAGLNTAAQGLGFGLLVWLGFSASTSLVANMYSDKPIGLFFIDSSYQLVYLLIMGTVLAAWR